jgi:Amt family ammonium transporter
MNCNPDQYFLDYQCVNYANYNEKISSILGEDAILDNGNTAWMLVASSMVMLMTPGVALFYGGLAGKKNSNNTILMSVICMAVITLSWILVGYSLSFGDWNEFLGSYQWFLLRSVGGAPSGAYGDKIPHILFATFQ